MTEGQATVPRVALVTGGGQRLGRAIALRLAAEGWDLAVHFNRSAEAAEAVAVAARGFGRRAAVFGCDLADAAAVDALLGQVAAVLGPVTDLVNCAASFDFDTPDQFTATQWDRQLAINLRAPAQLARDLARQLPDGVQGGIVNLLDQKLANPNPDYYSYTIAKSGLAAVTDMLARHLAPSVRVNAVAPGLTLPSPEMSDARFAELHGMTPLGYGSTPDDIAGAVHFLLTAPAITGQTIYADAGERLWPRRRDIAFHGR